MKGPADKTRFVAKNYTASTTLKFEDLVHYGQFIMSVASQTFTVPTPVKALVGRECEFINSSTGNLTVSCTSGFLAAVNSYTVGTKDKLALECVVTTPGTYVWVPLAVAGTFSATTLASTLHAASAKNPLVAADEFVLADSEAAWGIKKVTGTVLKLLTMETVTTIGTLVNGATAKNTPIDADIVGYVDTEAANVIKKVTWTNVKAFLKTYFDTLYTSITSTAVAAFVPTYVWSGGAPTVTIEVHRQQTVGKLVRWNSDIGGTNGNGATTLTVTMPAGLLPTNVGSIRPVRALVSVNAAAYATVTATFDQADGTQGNRKVTVTTGTLTNAQAFRILLAGEHEIP